MQLDEPARVQRQGVKVGVLVCLGVAIALVVGEVTSVLHPGRSAQARTLSPVEEALEVVTAAVESAWLVRPESTDGLVVVDSLGRETRFYGADGRLEVRRPNGRSGVLLSGLQAVAFETSTMRRLREGKPVRLPGVAWRRAADVEAPLVLAPGTSLALGMTLPSRAPQTGRKLKGVPEQLLRCEPQRFVLGAAGVPAGHTPCSIHEAESGSGVQDVLTVALHEGFAPDDPRPFGPAIASVSMPLGELLAWTSGSTEKDVAPVCWLCPLDETVSAAGPGAGLPLDLSEMQAVLAPGRAYSIVLSVEGSTPLVIGASPAVRPERSGSAFRARREPVYDTVPWQVPARLEGIRVYSRTVPHEVVDRVSVILTWKDGRQEVAQVAVAARSDGTHVPNAQVDAVPQRSP